MSTTITLRKNGSIRVEGDFTLIGEDGTPMTVEAGKGVSLCRCGDSLKRPFCDGTHKANGYCSTVPAAD